MNENKNTTYTMKKLNFILIALMGAVSLMAQTNAQGMDSAAVRQLLDEVGKPQYSSTMELNIDDAISYAIQQNRSLKNASLAVREAHAKRWQTIASMLPQADGTASYTDMCGYEMNFSGMKMAMPPYASHTVTASMALNGQMIVGALLSNIAIEMQDISREQSEDAMRANVKQSYLSVLVMEQVVNLLDSNLINLERLAAQARRMAEVGATEQTEADKIQVQVNTYNNTVKQYRRNLQLAYNSLRVLLNVGNDVELSLLTGMDNMLSGEQALSTLFEEFNINNNHNYRLLQKNVDIAKKNVVMAGLAYTPTMSAAYQFTAKKYLSDEKTFNMQPPHLVSVNVSIPLWSSGKRAAGVTEKKIALEEAENTLNETGDNLAIQYEQLRFNLASAYETYMTDKDNLNVTQRIFQNMANKYEWGAASALELTNASSDLISAETTYTNSVMSLVNAQIALENFLNNK